MRTLARAFLAFCGAYALDFASSALFMAIGYGFVEANQSQRAFLASPGYGTFASWLVNQDFRVALLVAGAVALAVPRIPAEKVRLSLVLGLSALFSLYGVASNVSFTLEVVAGADAPVLLCYGVLGGVAVLAFRHDIRTALSSLRNGASDNANRTWATFDSK